MLADAIVQMTFKRHYWFTLASHAALRGTLIDMPNQHPLIPVSMLDQKTHRLSAGLYFPEKCSAEPPVLSCPHAL